jgi:hypothetical protein
MGTCSLVASADDLDTCTGTDTCSATGVCLLQNGEVSNNANLCASGHAADGFCCDTDCTMACRSCGLAGTEGTCSLVTSGNDPGTCTGANNCDASGNCV